MSVPQTSSIVRVTHTYAQGAQQVFDAWVTPELARQFLFATPPKGEVIRCDIDARPGGIFTIVDKRPLDDDAATIEIEHVGRYLQVDAPRRIGFTFSVPAFSDKQTTAVIDIESRGEGTVLTLRHDMGQVKPGEEEEAQEIRERTEQGWTTILANLAAALQNK